MYVVGRLHSSAVQVILGAEPARPKDVIAGEEAGHEGESAAAKRLVGNMIALYGTGFFDILTTDAHYANKPFVLFVDSLGKYRRVKDKRTTLYKEIDTLSQMVEPIHVDDRENRVESLIYEIPELHAVLDWDVPTRGFKIVEKAYKIMGETQNHTINSREDKIMSKGITTKRNIKRFTDQCFDRESEKAARIIKGVLDAGSSRLSAQAFRKSLSKKEMVWKVTMTPTTRQSSDS